MQRFAVRPLVFVYASTLSGFAFAAPVPVLVQVTSSIAPAFQYEKDYLATPPGSGAVWVATQDASTSESHLPLSSVGIYEFSVPTLPTGGSFTAVQLNYHVSNLSGSAPGLNYATYAGNGYFNTEPPSDLGVTPGSNQLGASLQKGSNTASLPVGSAAAPWLGLYLSHRSSDGAVAISNGGTGSTGPAPFVKFTANVPSIGTLNTQSMVDGRVASNNATPVDENQPITVQEGGGSAARGVMEFNLSGLPDASKLSSATLKFNVGGYSSATTGAPLIYGYVGDGKLTGGDYGQTSNLLGTGGTVSANGDYVVTLDLAKLNSLVNLGQLDTLGLLVQGPGGGKSFTYSNLESGNGPTLSLGYSTPEPATLAALAGVGVLATRRRRRAR